MRAHRKPVLFGALATLAILVAATSFIATRSVKSGSAVDAAPDAAATPTPAPPPPPGTTPDIRQPGWYVPYVTADGAKPKFQGELAGLQLRPYDDTVPAEDAGGCPPGTKGLRELVDESVNTRPLGIRLGSFSQDLASSAPPQALECDGALVTVSRSFDVAAERGGGQGAGSLKVFRASHGNRFWVPAPQDRWTEGVVAGRPAAILQPVIGTVGTSAVVVNDASGYTALVGEGVSVEFLKAVAEEIDR